MAQGKKTVEDHEIVEKMETSPEPAFTTRELADEFGMTTEGIRNRLNKLAEAGRIHKKKSTNRVILWWTPSSHGPDQEVFST